MKNPVVYGACVAAIVMVLGGCGSGRESLTITGGDAATEGGSAEAGGGDDDAAGKGGTGGQAGQGGETGGDGGDTGTGGSDAGGNGGAAGTGGGTGGAAGGAGTGGGGTGGAGGTCTGWPTVNSTCNPVEQCGCPASGPTACKVMSRDGRSWCEKPKVPELEPGKSCTSYQECAGGTCLTDDTESLKVCWEYCKLGVSCKNGGACNSYNFFGSPPVPVQHVGICTHQCGPWNGDGCGKNLSCDVPRKEDGTELESGVSVCSHHDPKKGQGQSCSEHKECPVGFGCVRVDPDQGNGNLSCRKWCKVALHSGCDSGNTCKSFEPVVKVNEDMIGYCAKNN